MILFSRFLVLLFSLGLVLGCSSSKNGQAITGQEQTLILQEVNDLLQVASAGGRPPAKLADLNKQSHNFPRGYAAVKSGEVVVLWGAPVQGEGEVGNNEVVVAYE